MSDHAPLDFTGDGAVGYVEAPRYFTHGNSFFIPGLDELAFRVGEAPEYPPPSRRGRLLYDRRDMRTVVKVHKVP